MPCPLAPVLSPTSRYIFVVVLLAGWMLLGPSVAGADSIGVVEKSLLKEQDSTPVNALAEKKLNQNADFIDGLSPDNAVKSDELAVAFVRNIAGADAVPLNVPDASSPADIQDPLHLDEASAFAIKNNFEILASQEKINQSRWDKLGAYGEYLPSMSANGDTGIEQSAPASINDASGNRVLYNEHNRKDRTFTFKQPILDLSILADIVSAGDKQDVTELDHRDTREGILYDTAAAYLDVLEARLTVQLSADYQEYLDRLAARIKSRVQGGGAAPTDLERIKGRSTMAAEARVDALGQYKTSLAELRRLTHITPAQIVVPDVLVPRVPEDEMQAKEISLKNNPAYLSALGKVDLADDDRNKAVGSLMPKISATYSNSYTFNAGGAAEGNPIDGVYPVQKTRQALLVAQWDIGAPTIASGGSAMAKSREMSYRAQDQRRRIEQGIEASYAAMNAARMRQNDLRMSVDANEKVLHDFDEQFNMGGRSLFDVLDAYEQVYNARLKLMRVVIAHAKAAYQIRRQMGTLAQAVMKSENR